jgi:hypothetical protein
MTDTQTNWPDPTKQHKPNADQFRKDPNVLDHAQVSGDGKPFEGSGKDMGLMENAPIVKMHPSSATKSDNKPKDFKLIDNANVKLNHHIHKEGHYEFGYPFADLIVGQGIFIPLPENGNIDKFMIHMHKQVDQFRKQNSVVEKDEEGDDVMEDVAINKKKRNDDGTIQLDGDTPRLGIKSGFRPKLIGPTFAVSAAVKGDDLSENNKAEGDGVLVIRMS